MITTASTTSAKAMTKAEAAAITERIREHIDAAWADITRAHEGKAWKALGYSTWEAYVSAEFSLSRQRSYQLIDQGKVIHAFAEATGENVKHVGQISARDVDAVKGDLPAVANEIRAKVEAGEPAQKAVADTVAAKRIEKEKAKAAENDRLRQEHVEALPDAIKLHQKAKADAVAARKARPVDIDGLTAELEELREANIALVADLASVKADNARWEAMRVQYEQGGFEKVIAGKNEEIRVLETRLYSESSDKASWMRSAKYWQEEARKLGFSRDVVIDVETGEVVDG